MKYKALTLTPPWGTLIAIGAKMIETRGWSTSYRGPLLIHQGSNLRPVGGEQGYLELCTSDPFFGVLHDAGYRGGKPLPMGAIVAVCRLHSVASTDLLAQAEGAREIVMADQPITDGKGHYFNRYYVKEDRGLRWLLTDQERAFGDYTPGRYAWLLADIRALEAPIAARGLPGLWDIELPEGALGL